MVLAWNEGGVMEEKIMPLKLLKMFYILLILLHYFDLPI